MEDLHEIGGIPRVLKYLLDNDYLHGECLTVTGKSIRENLQNIEPLTFNQDVIRSFESPIKKKPYKKKPFFKKKFFKKPAA